MSTALGYRVRIAPEFRAWRKAARQLLIDGVVPDTVEMVGEDDDREQTLGFPAAYPADAARACAHPAVPKGFLDAAAMAACHADPERWQLLYRILWRLQTARDLLHRELDADVSRLERMRAQVARDLHKMHAFLRFRLVAGEAGEHYIAWYRPDHHILPLAVPFFAERFAVMRWTIMTVDATAHWDPESQRLTWGPGVPRSAAPQEDELEDLWRTYYASIFNPARANTRAMRAEMPTRYWQNLPELNVLPQLLAEAGNRVETMIQQQNSLIANTFVPAEHTLPALADALPRCEGCELYKCATQAVFGRGAAHTPLMLVGEQPGDEEDRAGEPFVGPAGRLLNGVLEELALDRSRMYVTNAVKHFKFTERGKRRIHASPSLRETMACRPWLLAEIDAVQPRVIVALGATAAKSLLGAKFALMKERGRAIESPYARQVVATVHPSAVLRAPEEMRASLHAFLKEDLALANSLAAAGGISE